LHSSRQDRLVSLLIALFPLLWLFRMDQSFGPDWSNHVWVAGYFGEYVRQHWSFPSVLNTYPLIGLPIPVFYGTLFYPMVGALSAVAGANAAIRLVIVGVMWLQALQVMKLVRIIYPGRYVAWILSAICALAIYPLTNVYNRSALTEVVAVSLVMSACSIWLSATLTNRGWKGASFAWLLFTLAVGAHPITAMLGSLAFSAVLLTSFLVGEGRKRLFVPLLWHAAAFVLVLAPWIYATGRFSHALRGFAPASIVMFEGLDEWWVRLMPFPLDPRTLSHPLNDVSTPYLDAQINIGLAIFVAFLGFQVIRLVFAGKLRVARESQLAACFVVACVAITACSVNRYCLNLLPTRFLSMMQFSYRLVTYADLTLFLAAILLLAALKKQQSETERPLVICLIGCLVLMVVGVIIKFSHVAAIAVAFVTPGVGFVDEGVFLNRLPPSYYGAEAYAVAEGFAGASPTPPSAVVFKAGAGADFGNVPSESVAPFQGSTVATNIEAFPWNRLYLDGVAVPVDKVHTVNGVNLSLTIPMGATSLSYKFEPDAAYTGLRVLSGTVLFLWICALCAFPSTWQKSPIVKSKVTQARVTGKS
jgi:hypothetical protein